MNAGRIILVGIILLAIAVPMTGYIVLCYPHMAHRIC